MFGVVGPSPLFRLFPDNADEAYLEDKAQGIPQAFQATRIPGNACQCRRWATWSPTRAECGL